MEDDRRPEPIQLSETQREEALDRANRDSFPASDPPALTQPQRATDRANTPRRKRS